MSQDEIPHPLVSQKQISILRKATLQSIEPVIKKVQEHISYLLNETQLLRQKNQQLNKTIADHSIINQRLQTFNNQLHKLTQAQNNQSHSHKQLQMQQKQKYHDLSNEINSIKSNLLLKQQKLQKLFKQQQNSSDSFTNLREQFIKFGEQNSEKVQQVKYQVQRISYQSKYFQENSNNSISSIQRQIQDRDQKYKQSDKKLELYLNEREQLRTLISQIHEKMDKTVDLEIYDRDRKIIKLENDAMKQQNRKMVDEALTPQVRKFLPEIISRMDQLRKVDKVEQNFEEQKIRTKSIIDIHTAQFLDLQVMIKQHYNELLNLKQSTSQKISKNQQEFQKLVSQEIQKLNNSISTIESDLTCNIRQTSESLGSRISTVVTDNREYIYKLVDEQVPQQKKEMDEKMRQFIPLLQKTKEQITQRCDQITQFGKGLEEQLSNFNNKLIKIRSNMTVEFQSLQKKNRSLQLVIQKIFNDHFPILGKIVSAYCQILMAGLSAQVQSYGGTNGDDFVTYTDGMIYQGDKKASDNSSLSDQKIIYRRVQTFKGILTKSTLQILLRLCDQLICGEEYSFLKINKFKPSQHFKEIKQEIMHKKNGLTLQSYEKERQNSTSRKAKRNKDVGLPSLELNQSKTIDSSRYPDNYHEHLSQTMNSDFGGLKQKIDRKAYKSRYSNAK